MSQSVRSGRGTVLPVALLGAALLSTGTAGLAFADGTKPQPKTVAPLSSSAEAAATWAAHQLDARSNAQGDHGLTADIVMGLASTGTGDQIAQRATTFLQRNADQYVYAAGKGKLNVGGTAKLALVAEIMHREPWANELTTLVKGSLQKNGRFLGHATDTSQQFTQSLGVLALQRAGGAPKEAVDFIAASQCKNGGFPLALKDKPDPDTCTPHTDATGMAVQALFAAGRTAEAENGLKWLVDEQQLPNGGFADPSQTPGKPKTEWQANANSTALAVQALLAGRRTSDANSGIDWLRSVQVGCAAKDADDRGAVGWKEAVADGLALRATAQAIPALARQPLAHIDGGNLSPDLTPMNCPGGNGSNGGTGSDGGTGGTPTKSPGGTPPAPASGSPSPEASTPAPSTSATATATATGTPTSTATSDTTTGGGSESSTGSGGTSGTGSSSGTGTSSGTGSAGDNASGSLARTGASKAFPVAVGAGALLLAGSAAVVVSRRRRSDDTV
ncbi:LPXTG cell wall anchor domain-containing protein [Streptomyces sp. I05A-00742]|uniref:LPXTG cell wall anchor domain-containing protein n=1 Tax=Streptomyces sp. I05A-00742 TaxID=2732853 RepID=UPI00148812EE|nr:LPXTG cell wall anchor domain-containing protein [Streptomyces sp. I05A-00742]